MGNYPILTTAGAAPPHPWRAIGRTLCLGIAFFIAASLVGWGVLYRVTEFAGLMLTWWGLSEAWSLATMRQETLATAANGARGRGRPPERLSAGGVSLAKLGAEDWEALVGLLEERFEWRPGAGALRALIGPGLARVLVCGGRGFEDYDFLAEKLDAVHAEVPIGAVIHGAARGADVLAGRWAAERSVTADAYVAEWAELGSKAGPIRNERMLSEGRPDLVIAFPGRRGTAHMMVISARAGRPVLRVDPSGRVTVLGIPGVKA